MKAATSKRYGKDQVIQITETEAHKPKANEILIKVHAATVNRTDCGFLTGLPLIVRPFSGLFTPRRTILGCEFAGEVVDVGDSVAKFKPGDKVFGLNEWNFGCHAEYLVIGENEPVALMPEGWSFIEAAPMSEGAYYAYFDLKSAKIKAGDKVMVYGATGGIGSAAVQLARSMGATVTAICHTAGIPLMHVLGAHQVIDYTNEDFTREKNTYDLVFDAVGKSTFGHCKSLLKPKGIYISTEFGPWIQNPILAIATSMFDGKRVLFPLPTLKQSDVEYFAQLAREGKYKPVIDRVYDFAEIPAAYRYVFTGQKTGNVVIRVATEENQTLQ